MRVCVYKNLHLDRWSVVPATKNGNRGRWSVVPVKGNNNRGVGVWHVDACALENATFVVKESRRQAVIRDHCREVHAWVVGDLVEVPEGRALTEVTYNPFRAPKFHTRDGNAIEAAPCVVFTDRAYLAN